RSRRTGGAGHLAPPGEQQGAAVDAAGARDDGDLGAGDLPGAGLAAQLAHRLGDVPEAGVEPPARQLAAPRVERQLTGETDPLAARHERPGLAGAAEPERLEPPGDGDREPVVELGDVDVGGAKVGPAPERVGARPA